MARAQGYGKRYGAAYADTVTGTFSEGRPAGAAETGSALFYKEPQHAIAILYAIANSVICKGDNGHWQLNYSASLEIWPRRHLNLTIQRKIGERISV